MRDRRPTFLKTTLLCDFLSEDAYPNGEVSSEIRTAFQLPIIV